jgi:hypothetical protein
MSHFDPGTSTMVGYDMKDWYLSLYPSEYVVK